jgi:hypothetical protein
MLERMYDDDATRSRRADRDPGPRDAGGGHVPPGRAGADETAGERDPRGRIAAAHGHREPSGGTSGPDDSRRREATAGGEPGQSPGRGPLPRPSADVAQLLLMLTLSQGAARPGPAAAG